MTGRRIALLAGLAVLGLATAVPVWARDVVTLEAVGAAPVDATTGAASRDAAVRMALLDAVERVARGMLPPGATEPGVNGEPETDLSELLGADPFPYTTRFQTIEDRGVRSALFGSGADQAQEYVVVVEVDVDRGRVRERLSTAGLMSVPVGGGARPMRLALENMNDYGAYERIREALSSVGVRSAVAVEAEPGRMVLELDSDRSPRDLVRPLQLALPDLGLTPTTVGPDGLTLVVSGGGPGGIPPAAASESLRD